MNLDLKNAYETAIKLAHAHTDITIDLLKSLSALVMKNTGQEYKTALGDFSSAKGDLRLLNVTAGGILQLAESRTKKLCKQKCCTIIRAQF